MNAKLVRPKRTPAKKKSTEPSICWRGRRALLTPGVADARRSALSEKFDPRRRAADHAKTCEFPHFMLGTPRPSRADDDISATSRASEIAERARGGRP
jgi:hypothetical protein